MVFFVTSKHYQNQTISGPLSIHVFSDIVYNPENTFMKLYCWVIYQCRILLFIKSSCVTCVSFCE